MLRTELCALISVLNLDRSSFFNMPHDSFPLISPNTLPEPPCLNALLDPLQVSRNASMQILHCSAVRFAVQLSAFSSIVDSYVRESNSTSRRARSRDQSSRMTSWYSADAPRLSSKVFAASLINKQTAMQSPTEKPKGTAIVEP